MPQKQLPKSIHIRISHGCHGLSYPVVGAFEQALGFFYAEALLVGVGRVAGGLLEAADEVAAAHAEVVGQFGDGDIFAKMFFQVALDLQHGLVCVQLLVVEDHEGCLGSAVVVYFEDFRKMHGRGLVDKLLDQVDDQVEGGEGAAGGVHAVHVGDHGLRPPLHARIERL